MERKVKRFKTSSFIAVITAIVASISLCFADIPSSKDSETMAAFSKSLDTELGDSMRAFFEENDLEIGLNNSFSTSVLGGDIILVPLTSRYPHPMTAVRE